MQNTTADQMIKVPIKRFAHGAELSLPKYATEASAGVDLISAVSDNLILQPNERSAVPTGIAVALPDGYEAQIRPRSGLAIKYGVTCLNSPGTIDPDYRGEIFVILINHGQKIFFIKRGMKIAQLIIAPYKTITWDEVKELSSTNRGEKGLGSTGE